MKYIVILGDGMADEPIDALGGKTPLACAETPVMDELASKGANRQPGAGLMGLVTSPRSMKPSLFRLDRSMVGTA